jgi:tetratricopeptide (TPR) repeat protein
MSSLKQLISEIHRRSLWQVLAIYIVGGWIGYSVIQGLTEGLNLPSWFPALALVLFIVGLPIVLATSFLQEGFRTWSHRDPTLIPDAVIAVGVAGGTPSATASCAWRDLFTWRNAIMGGVFAFALFGVFSAGWLLVAGTPTREVPVAEDGSGGTRVAVLPFSVRGSEEFAYLGEGMVNLLSTKLDGAGDLRTVDPRALIGALERDRVDQLDPARAGALAGSFGAGLYVLGDVVEIGGQLHLEAALYDVSQGNEPVATATSEVSVNEVFSAVDDLAAQLLVGRSGGGGRSTGIATVTTHSLPALRAYLEGEREFRSGRFEQALSAFQRAIVEDSAFALAYYRLSIVAEWLVRADLAGDYAEQASQLSDRLSDRDQRVLQAFMLWREGDADQAERLYRSILGTHPDDVEVWWQLGELLFHYGPRRGRSVIESRAAWERVLFFEPNHVPALVHMARIASVEKRPQELDSLIRLALAYQPGGDYAIYMNALLAYGLEDEAAKQQIRSDLALASDNARNNAVYNVSVFTDDVDGAAELAELIIQPSRTAAVRVSGRVVMTNLDLARGRWRSAQAQLSAAETLDYAAALEHRTLYAIVPFFATPDSVLDELRATLVAWDPPAAPAASDPYAVPHDDLHPQLRVYLLGLLNARLGREAEARRYARQLDEMGGSPEAQALARDQVQGVLAQIAWTRGDEGGALAILQQAPMIRSYLLTVNSSFYALNYVRYMRAELLNALGRYEEAASWYCSFLEHSTYDVAFLGPSHFRRAEMYEKLGRPDEAARHYNRFLELWSEADAEYQPLVAYARERLASLLDE